jgi:hypothetical protein
VNGEQVLAVPLTPNAQRRCGGGTTVRDYLMALLRKLWDEGEEFSGKHPFGDSGWQYDLYASLADAGLIPHGYRTCGGRPGRWTLRFSATPGTTGGGGVPRLAWITCATSRPAPRWTRC